MLCHAIRQGRMVTRVTNREFLNTLIMVDINMERLDENYIKILMAYPDLEREFHQIGRAHQFLGNLQILKIILIKYLRNKGIVENLCLLEYVGAELGRTEVCRKYIGDMLYTDWCGVGGNKIVSGNWGSVKFIPNRDKLLQFGDILMKIVGENVIAEDCNEGSSGLLCTGFGFIIEDKELRFTVRGCRDTSYKMRIGEKGLYVADKRKYDIGFSNKVITAYKGYIKCDIQFT